MMGLPTSVRENPPIPFISKARKLENPEDGTDKTQFIKLDFFMDPNNPASKYTKHFVIFKDGCAEDWIRWLMGYREIESLMDLTEPADKSKMVRTLLKGQALSHFEHHLRKRLEAEDADLPDNDLLELVLRDVGLEYIPKSAIRVQKYYMRRGLFLGPNVSVQTFVERLNELNQYLLYFPEENPKQLDQDEIIEILDQAKAPEWHAAMVSANIDIFSMTYEDSVAYFKRLENLEKIRKTNGLLSPLTVDYKKTGGSSTVVGLAVGKKKSAKMWCHYCDKNNHNTADCRAIAKAKQRKNGNSEAKAVPGKKSLAFLFEEINSLKKQLNTKIPNSKKRKIETVLSNEINLTTTSDEDEEYFPFFYSLHRIKSNKLAKTTHPTSELVVSLKINNKEYLLRALADSGASSSIILEDYTSKNLIQRDKNQTTWSTMGGQFTTDKTGLVTFSLPEFNLKKLISWKFHIDNRSKLSSTYDMIIGRDLLGELGIILNFNDHTVTWDTDTIPMKDRGTLNTQEAILEVYLASNEPKSLVDEYLRSTKILDAEYKPAILEEVTQTCTNLNQEEQHKLLELLQKYEHLFDGTVGEFKMDPIRLHLIDKGVKPVHARPYAVPRAVEQQLRTEIARLVDIGVLEEDYTSEWASPSFAISKKNGTIRVVSDFRKLNSLLKRHPFPIPKIGDIIRSMEGFTFATSLDLNMGYYHIKLDADAQRLCTIIFPWGNTSTNAYPWE
jgi:hypothetical protein